MKEIERDGMEKSLSSTPGELLDYGLGARDPESRGWSLWKAPLLISLMRR